MDPSIGFRRLSYNEFSNCFTGIAVEFWPNNDFKKKIDKEKVDILSFLKTYQE
ncbi:hypothetical protein Phpb_01300 [Photorhabdus namnaonensis]|uniref:Uncharacterized protein n=1 Tax=Photorhabdus namnaonensis TaxID=1851568 RepID=A0A1B8YKU8_9GAMM|nr:hypothetical protein Phpb_01300 [Photorhabdus namnaonensis]